MNRFLITWVFFLPLGVFAQDVGVGSPAEPGVSAQSSVIQRVEIVARQGSTELRRAASFAKQIYGREELPLRRHQRTGCHAAPARCER